MASWQEATRWDGHNYISRATGSQWDHQSLHRSRRGRYWLQCWSQWQGTTPHAEWLDPHEAAWWLLANEEDLPDDLEQYRDAIEE